MAPFKQCSLAAFIATIVVAVVGRLLHRRMCRRLAACSVDIGARVGLDILE